ncbi:MAG TPA: GNAT family N-acetyltransferase, partial [Candidatus Limnocylindria bacterium]|nr:GNAT family N-acetyltransferase [Candidatus Limnocylindria bacterium]
EDEGRVVGMAAYDTRADGKCFFPLAPEYGRLRGDMIAWAKERLRGSGPLRLFIRDGDFAFQKAARDAGFTPTQERDEDTVMPIDTDAIRYSLPEGFRITDMKEDYDLFRYGQVLWKGFNHEKNGEGPYSPTPEDERLRRGEFERPNVDLGLKIAVVAPGGDFASYCGMWHDPASPYALVEPVATDPAYRRLGLGRAAVLEGVRRCGVRGAKWATVGSSQQFYYDIGFSPWLTSTFWAEKAAKPEG